jgi:hypothetical protein
MSVHLNQTTTFPDRSEIVNRAFVDYVRRYEITPDKLASGVFRLPVQAGDVVLNVRAIIAEAFNGTTPTVKIGDKADDDGFLIVTDLAVGTAGAMQQSLRLFTEASGVAAFNPYGRGRYYAADNQILVTFAGAPTQGRMILEVVFSGYPSESPSYMIAKR